MNPGPILPDFMGAPPEDDFVATAGEPLESASPVASEDDVIDALRTVGDGINSIMRRPDKAVLLITHYQRLLDYVQPDFVHVLAAGRIVKSGGPELARELEEHGYAEVVA